MSDSAETIKVYFIDGTFKGVSVIPNSTTVEELWEIISDKLEFTLPIAQNFFIWGREGDLEILLYADKTITETKRQWPEYMKKYSDLDKKHLKDAGKNFRFVYKPTSILPIKIERNLKDKTAVNLFYIQVLLETFGFYIKAVFNIVNSNYPCLEDSALELAGLQAFVSMGDRKPHLHQPGHLGKDICEYIPKHLFQLKKIAEWEKLVYIEQEKHNGRDKHIAQLLYLQIVRQWRFYGSIFFSGIYKPSSQTFYAQEFFGQVVIGVNGYGIHLMDPIQKKVISIEFAKILHPDNTDSMFSMQAKSDTPDQPPKQFIFKTKHAELIVDLIHDWWAEIKKTQSWIAAQKKRQEAYTPSTNNQDAVVNPSIIEEKFSVLDLYSNQNNDTVFTAPITPHVAKALARSESLLISNIILQQLQETDSNDNNQNQIKETVYEDEPPPYDASHKYNYT